MTEQTTPNGIMTLLNSKFLAIKDEDQAVVRDTANIHEIDIVGVLPNLFTVYFSIPNELKSLRDLHHNTPASGHNHSTLVLALSQLFTASLTRKDCFFTLLCSDKLRDSLLQSVAKIIDERIDSELAPWVEGPKHEIEICRFTNDGALIKVNDRIVPFLRNIGMATPCDADSALPKDYDGTPPPRLLLLNYRFREFIGEERAQCFTFIRDGEYVDPPTGRDCPDDTDEGVETASEDEEGELVAAINEVGEALDALKDDESAADDKVKSEDLMDITKRFLR